MTNSRPPPPGGQNAPTDAALHTDRLPDEVVTCLQNARFLHLATCTSNEPHVSLMNYTYLPPNTRPYPNNNSGSSQASLPLPPGPSIIMTSNPRSKKTANLLSNPNVSLLVHDWVSSRPPANITADLSSVGSSGSTARDRSPTGGRPSTLATMLMQMNSAAVSSISATMEGQAYVLPAGSAEERWCKEQHLANNTFAGEEETGGTGRVRRPQQVRALSVGEEDMMREGDGGRESYIEDEEARVVVVQIRGGRISDWKGRVKDWVIRVDGEEVNGV